MATANIWTGAYTGTGASQQVRLNWKPVAIGIYDVDGKLLNIKFKGMPATSFATLSTAGITNTLTNGINFTNTGFTVGTSEKINKSGNQYHYLALKGN